MMDKSVIIRWIAILTLVALVLVPTASAQSKRVLFYQIGTVGGMTIEGEYSDYAEELRNRGYTVASLTKGKLDKNTLEGYDILIVQNIQKSLDSEEISAILTFVLNEGKGVYINGVSSKSNQLTLPFGVAVDEGKLIDTTDPLPQEKKNSYFVINRFDDDDTTKTLRQGVQKLGFYEGNGLKISGEGKCIAMGDEDTYSDTGSFRVGDAPCIATATRVGKGLIFITADVDMLSNKYMADFSNKNFGLNIMEWLQIRINESIEISDLPIILAECKLQMTRLGQETSKLEQEKGSLLTNVNSLTSRVSELQTDYDECQGGKLGPFTPTNWAIIIAAVLILLAAIIYTRRKAALAKGQGGEAEELEGDLGYEFEKEGEGGGGESEDLNFGDVLDTDILEE
ncbi:MAG: hypothetical protein ABH950_05235 [Candidatus Altiarchaeota archaeon]